MKNRKKLIEEELIKEVIKSEPVVDIIGRLNKVISYHKEKAYADDGDNTMEDMAVDEYSCAKGYELLENLNGNGEYYPLTIDKLLALFGNGKRNIFIDKVLMYNLREISNNQEEIYMAYLFFKNMGIVLETIEEGIIGEDYLFGISAFENVKEKEELKNNPHLVEYPF